MFSARCIHSNIPTCKNHIRGHQLRSVNQIASNNSHYVKSLNRFPRRNFHDIIGQTETFIVGGVIATGALAAFTMSRYKIAKPSEMLIRTGMGINDIKITKQGWLWPFQLYEFISLEPKNYSVELIAMSSEKLSFKLPGVFTIGPKNEQEALIKYARTLSDKSKNVDTVIKGIIEGELRSLAGTMTMESLFNDRKVYKDTVIKAIQEELDKFGLLIFNSNLSELCDGPESKYFTFLRQKVSAEAEQTTIIHVSEAKKQGAIGSKERESTTRQQVAQLETAAVLKENERYQEIERSKAELEVVKAEAARKTEVAHIESKMAAQMIQAERQKDVEQKRVMSETEKIRALEMSKSQVQAEVAAKEAEGKSNAIKIEADAHLYSQMKHAEASLYTREKEATGILAVYNAQSQGINKLIGTFNNNPNALLQYLMLDKGIYQQLAQTNAEAIKGLAPKIVTWVTTSDNKNGSDPSKAIADIFKMLPPLLTTINDQTGIKPADWLMKLPEAEKSLAEKPLGEHIKEN